MENLGQIEDWRKTLPLSERVKLNHPDSVLRKWKAFMRPEPRTEDGQPRPTLRDSVVNLSEEVSAKDREIAALRAHIEELEAARAPTADSAAPVEQVLEGRALENALENEFEGVVERVFRLPTDQLQEMAATVLYQGIRHWIEGTWLRFITEERDGEIVHLVATDNGRYEIKERPDGWKITYPDGDNDRALSLMDAKWLCAEHQRGAPHGSAPPPTPRGRRSRSRRHAANA
jgi:hypothetical protein